MTCPHLLVFSSQGTLKSPSVRQLSGLGSTPSPGAPVVKLFSLSSTPSPLNTVMHGLGHCKPHFCSTTGSLLSAAHEELGRGDVRLEVEGGTGHFTFVIPWLPFFLFLWGLSQECFFTLEATMLFWSSNWIQFAVYPALVELASLPLSLHPTKIPHWLSSILPQGSEVHLHSAPPPSS